MEGLQREAARPLFNNPSLTAEGGRRRADGVSGSANEWTVGIAQPLELGGQQARRREAAAAALEALRAEIDDARRQARADAATRFQAIVAAERRVAARAPLDRAVRQRLASGRAAPCRRRGHAPGCQCRPGRSRALAQCLGRRQRAAARRPERTGDAAADVARPAAGDRCRAARQRDAAVDAAAYGLEPMLQAAQALPRLRALAAREDAARARLDVERANRYPDVTVGVSHRPRRLSRRPRAPDDAFGVGAAADLQAQRGSDRPGADGADAGRGRAHDCRARRAGQRAPAVAPSAEPARARAAPAALVAAGLRRQPAARRCARARPARSACSTRSSSTARRSTPSAS